jgi:hypothetical protein
MLGAGPMCILIGISIRPGTCDNPRSDERNAKGVGNIVGHVNVGIESVIVLSNMRIQKI